MHAPVPSHAEHCVEAPSEQQLVWQSPVVHCASDEHVAPAASSEQSPDTTEYGVLQAVQAPVASQALQCVDLPAAQQNAWQSPLVHCALAVHAVPVGARQLPAEAV